MRGCAAHPIHEHFRVGAFRAMLALPPSDEQLSMLAWCLSRMEEVLAAPGKDSWTKRWLEVLKRPGHEMPKMPPYGFGDAKS